MAKVCKEVPMTRDSNPQSLVDLSATVPGLLVDIRYGGTCNFYGAVLPGYEAKVALGSRPLAASLLEVQKHLTPLGYDLVVYEAYRPAQAGVALYAWASSSEMPEAPGMREKFFPTLTKERLFEEGYIARKSAHTRASAVDVSLLPRGQVLQEPKVMERRLSDGRRVLYLEDGTLDMGTHFDFLDPASHQDSALVSPAALENRRLLSQIMHACGLKGYSKEWWHFQLVDEPFPDTYFDMPVRGL